MPSQTCRTRPAQRGVVLVIALIMLVIISLLATMSIRNAASSETVSGNVRTTMLASQAAEIALRYCEDTTVAIRADPLAAPTGFNILPATSTPRWTTTTKWDDTPGTDVFLIPLASVNQTGPATFKRVPECMVERVEVVNSAGTALSDTSTYVITARGFGPEVAAGTGRPAGSEVWLQSTIELQ